MTEGDLRRRINGIRHLPVHPGALVELLRALEGSGPLPYELICGDPSLAVLYLRSFSSRRPSPELSQPVVRTFALPHLGRVLRGAYNPPSEAEERVIRNAAALAAGAAEVARATGGNMRQAYVAGMVADVGRLLLADLPAETVSEDAARRAGLLFARHAEIPEVYRDVVWLRRHDVAAMDAELFPIARIAAVQMADMLLHEPAQDQAGASATHFDQKRQRDLERYLGVHAEDLRETVAEAAASARERLKAPRHDELLKTACNVVERLLLAGGRAEERNARAQERLARLEAILGWARQTPKGGAERLVQWIAAGAAQFSDLVNQPLADLRKDTMGAGLCVVPDAVEGGLWLGTWSGGGPVHVRPLPENEIEQDGDLRKALDALGLTAAPEDAPHNLVRWGKLLALPFTVDGERVGQVIFECDPPLGQEAASDLGTFSRLAGNAVVHWRDAQRQQLRLEALAEGLQHVEQAVEAPETENLARIAGFTEEALRDLTEPLVQALGASRKLVGELEGQPQRSEAMSALVRLRQVRRRINDLLLVAGPVEAHPQAVDVVQVLEELARRVRGNLDERGITLEVNNEAGLPEAWVDRRHLAHMINSLVSGGAAAAELAGKSLSVVARRINGNARLVLEFADSGPALDADAAAHLFEPGQAVLAALGRDALSLSAVRRAAELNGGQLEALLPDNSNENRGSAAKGLVFRLTLPAAERRAQPPTESQGVVLLAERDEAARAAMEKVLSSRNYRVRSVTHQTELLATAAVDLPDVILVDSNVYGREESMLADLVEAAPVPVIALSRFEEDRTAALEAGVRAFLHNPFRLRDLLDAIESVRAQG
jgi:CheY-like chemotaxis protein